MILEALLHKGPLTMSELCEAALITNASMTAAIDRLEQRAFVERVASKEDRRVRRAQLTAQGATLIKRLYARHERDLDEVMSAIPAAQRAELRRGLKTIGLAAQAKLSK
jgi:MarR family 2-MHQ and catechol resistance regulon transcriptional repressor